MKRTLTLAVVVLAGMLAQAASLNPPANLVAYVPRGPVTIPVLQVCLTWRDMSRSEIGFRVERADYDETTGDLGPWDTIAVLPRNATAWIDYEPLWQAWAAYRVVAISRKAEAPSATAFYKLQ